MSKKCIVIFTEGETEIEFYDRVIEEKNNMFIELINVLTDKDDTIK